MTNNDNALNEQERTYRAIASSGQPMLYSDGVLSYNIGSQVSRVAFGVETRPGIEAAPVVTMVLPTEALVTMISELRAVLAQPEIHQHMADATARVIQKAESLSG